MSVPVAAELSPTPLLEEEDDNSDLDLGGESDSEIEDETKLLEIYKREKEMKAEELHDKIDTNDTGDPIDPIDPIDTNDSNNNASNGSNANNNANEVNIGNESDGSDGSEGSEGSEESEDNDIEIEKEMEAMFAKEEKDKQENKRKNVKMLELLKSINEKENHFNKNNFKFEPKMKRFDTITLFDTKNKKQRTKLTRSSTTIAGTSSSPKSKRFGKSFSKRRDFKKSLEKNLSKERRSLMAKYKKEFGSNEDYIHINKNQIEKHQDSESSDDENFIPMDETSNTSKASNANNENNSNEINNEIEMFDGINLDSNKNNNNSNSSNNIMNDSNDTSNESKECKEKSSESIELSEIKESSKEKSAQASELNELSESKVSNEVSKEASQESKQQLKKKSAGVADDIDEMKEDLEYYKNCNISELSSEDLARLALMSNKIGIDKISEKYKKYFDIEAEESEDEDENGNKKNALKKSKDDEEEEEFEDAYGVVKELLASRREDQIIAQNEKSDHKKRVKLDQKLNEIQNDEDINMLKNAFMFGKYNEMKKAHDVMKMQNGGGSKLNEVDDYMGFESLNFFKSRNASWSERAEDYLSEDDEKNNECVFDKDTGEFLPVSKIRYNLYLYGKRKENDKNMGLASFADFDSDDSNSSQDFDVLKRSKERLMRLKSQQSNDGSNINNSNNNSNLMRSFSEKEFSNDKYLKQIDRGFDSLKEKDCDTNFSNFFKKRGFAKNLSKMQKSSFLMDHKKKCDGIVISGENESQSSSKLSFKSQKGYVFKFQKDRKDSNGSKQRKQRANKLDSKVTGKKRKPDFSASIDDHSQHSQKRRKVNATK